MNMEDRKFLIESEGMSSNIGRKKGRKEGRKQTRIVSRTEPWIIGMVERTLCRKVR